MSTAPEVEKIPAPGFKVTFTPNPDRKHSRGRRGHGGGGDPLPAEYLQAKENLHSKKLEAASKAKVKQSKAEAKAFRRRGFKEGMLRRAEFKGLKGKQLEVAVARSAHHTRTSGVDLSKATARMVRDFQKPFEGAKVPAPPKAASSSRAPASSASAPVPLREVQQLLSRFKRTQKLPPPLEAAPLFTRLSLHPTYPDVPAANVRRLLTAMRALLLAHGIEPNPGPQTKVGPGRQARADRKKAVRLLPRPVAGSSAESAEDLVKRSEQVHPDPSQKDRVKRQPRKPTAGSKAALTRLVEEELSRVHAEGAGQADAEEERQAAEAEERKAREAERDLQNAQHMPRAAAFHPFRYGDDVSWQDVAPRVDELRFQPLPHRVAAVRLVEVRGSEDLRAPHDHEVKAPKGNYHVATYTVRFEARSFLNTVMDQQLPGEEVLISPEVYAYARSRRIAQYCTFAQGVERVRAFRASHPDYHYNSRDPRAHGELNDQVFTALLMAETNGLSNSFFLELAMAQGFDTLKRAVMRDPNEPTVAGNYVRGYRVPVEALFAPIIAEARASVAAGSPIREAAEHAADAIVARGTSIAVESRRKLRSVGERIRASWEYCRALPVSIEGLTPSFPDPFDLSTTIVSAAKRILRPVKRASDMALRYEQEITNAILKRIKSFAPAEISAQELIAAAAHKAQLEPWTGPQKLDFVQGARTYVECDLATCVEELRTFAVFIKQETYDPEQWKASRFITAPAHYARGILFAAMEPAERHIVKCFNEHLVKGLRAEEMREKIRTAFQGHGSVFESDYKSFESLINRVHQTMVEIPCFTAATPAFFREKTHGIVEFLANTPALCRGAGLKLLPDTIRLSGVHNTSVGNAIENIVKSFAVLARSSGVPVDKVIDWFEEHRLPWFVEGDDAVFALGDAKLADVVQYHQEAGSEVTSEIHDCLDDAKFCGSHLLIDGCVFKDPLALVSRLTHWLGADQGTDKFDMDMLIAKAMSYGESFHHLPLVGPLCRAILRRNASRVKSLLTRFANPEEVSPALKFLRNYYKAQSHVGTLPSEPSSSSSDYTVVGLGPSLNWVIQPDNVSAHARVATQQLWGHLTHDVQVAAEAVMVKAVEKYSFVEGRVHALVIQVPSMASVWQQIQERKGQLTRFVQGKRERAAALTEHLSSAASLALDAAARTVLKDRTLKLSTLANVVLGIVGLSSLVMMVKALWLFVAMVGGLAVVLLSIVLGVWIFLGITPSWSLRGLRVLSWSALALVSVRWFARWYRSREAVGAAATAAASAPVPDPPSSSSQTSGFFSRLRGSGRSSSS